ncbi:membrane protein [Kocuria dechangensis]|uniref:Membrane protein n=1 Tax=Kocuria dechangensis TaxID=1176249 RepID=A0A917GZC6_9MICC|nr:DUF202 domain-containing protein [Kocuria dechangensis]GGG61530.1 membrane protein [Kocuria dechangensis]
MSGSSQDLHTTLLPGPPHDDPGLQPERTTLAWGRTILAFITAAAICLRWVSHHGVFVLALFALAVSTGAVIYLTQRTRYTRSTSGITAEQVAADVLGVLGLSLATVALGTLGIYTVLTLS